MVLVKKWMERILKDQKIITKWKAKFSLKRLDINMSVSGMDHENNAKTKRTKWDPTDTGNETTLIYPIEEIFDYLNDQYSLNSDYFI